MSLKDTVSQFDTSKGISADISRSHTKKSLKTLYTLDLIHMSKYHLKREINVH
jgi:hypothetical protein